MSGPDGLRRATREANERRLAMLRGLDPHLAVAAGRALRVIEDQARREQAAAARERLVRLNVGMTCAPSTASAVEAWVREQPACDVVVRAYPVGDDGRVAAPGREIGTARDGIRNGGHVLEDAAGDDAQHRGRAAP